MFDFSYHDSIIMSALFTFGLTLLITKSKVLSCKREFVEKRFQAAKINGVPSLIHKIWRAIWTCPMCCGMWVALAVCCFASQSNYFVDVIIVFGLNWLIHCVENVLFQAGKWLEKFNN